MPEVITGLVGDVVGAYTFFFILLLGNLRTNDVFNTEFDFYPVNHSVVRSDWGFPCVPYEDLGRGRVGFFSGFQPVDSILTNVSINCFSSTASADIKHCSPRNSPSESMILNLFSSTAHLRAPASTSK